jgi:DNA end-binding protein Ku
VKVESSSMLTVEKFVDTDSIDPVYYDAACFLAPDGDAWRDVYAVLREAIALRLVGDRLMAHTLYEDRDLNNSKDLFDGVAGIKTCPEMVRLATQPVQRQSGQYDASDLEDRYEIRLCVMIDAKLKGEGIDLEAEAPVAKDTNVIDLMAALKNSPGQAPAETLAAPKRKKSGEARQTGLKLPIKGGRTTDKEAVPAAKPSRKRA